MLSEISRPPEPKPFCVDMVVVFMPRYRHGHEADFVPPITGIHLAALNAFSVPGSCHSPAGGTDRPGHLTPISSPSRSGTR